MKYKINEILSDGYVMGEALKLIKENNESTKFVSKNIEIVKLNHSIQRTSNELIDMKHKNPDLADYLETERLIAVDPILRKGVTDKIEQDGLSAEAAVETVMDVYIHNLLNSKSNYLRERANDISDVTDRLIRNMSQRNDFSDDDRYILVTDVLYPSLLIQRRKSLVGVIAKRGGYTSHSAILCRSFEIPYVFLIIFQIRSASLETAIAALNLPAVEQGTPERRLVGIFELCTHRKSRRDARDPNPHRGDHSLDIRSRRLAFDRRIRR